MGGFLEGRGGERGCEMRCCELTVYGVCVCARACMHARGLTIELEGISLVHFEVKSSNGHSVEEVGPYQLERGQEEYGYGWRGRGSGKWRWGMVYYQNTN